MMHGEKLFVLLMCLTGTLVQAKRGIIVTVPETWVLQAEETICVSFHDIGFDVATETTVKVQYSSTDVETYKKEVTFNRGTDSCFTMVLTRLGSPYQADLLFEGSGHTGNRSLGYTFRQNTSISIQSVQAKANITFIETDKPIYKAGDKVQLRILTIQEELKPRMEKLPLVTIQNPSGIRIMQWRNVSVEELQGLANLSFDLSAEPSLGDWKISVVRTDGKKHKQTFTVQEYVLPKFEVRITPPAFIPIWGDTLETEICAMYTYGQPVKGNLTVSSCMKHRYLYARDGFGSPPCFEESIQLEGCHTSSFPLKAMLNEMHTYDYGEYVAITATVTEEGTDIAISSSAKTNSVSLKHYTIEFVDTPQYFRPGFNFTGKVKVTDNTGGAVEGIEVILEVQNTKTPVPDQTKQTDTKGIAMFEYSNLEYKDKSDQISLRAKLVSTHDYGNYSQKNSTS